MNVKILLVINRDQSYDKLSYYDDWVKAFVEHPKVSLTLIDYLEVNSLF